MQEPRNPARRLVDTATQLKIAVAAGASPKTVDKILLGRPVRGDVAHRIRAALADFGIEPLPGETDAPPANGEGPQP